MTIGKPFILDILKVVFVAVSLTFALTLGLFFSFYGDPRNYDVAKFVGLGMGIFIPAIISGPVSYYVFQQREKIREINAQLRKLIQYDPLTSLLTRRQFFEDAEIAIKGVAGKNQMCAVFFMDIDYFKKINDVYGHALGDNVLRQFGEVMSGLLNSGEILGRIGGEEFCLIHTNCNRDEAIQRADEILNAYRTQAEYIGEAHIRSTISIGVHVSIPGELDQMINEADVQLYRAKKAGRDCFAISDQGVDEVNLVA